MGFMATMRSTTFAACGATRSRPVWAKLARRPARTAMLAVSLSPCVDSRSVSWARSRHLARFVARSSSSSPHELSAGSMDEDLAHELAQIVGDKGTSAESRAASLDLAWRVRSGDQAVQRPNRCPCCEGKGHRECGYCGSTGFLSVGDHVIREPSSERALSCPVCKGTGEEPCKHCRGTGLRAGWLGTDPGACPL